MWSRAGSRSPVDASIQAASSSASARSRGGAASPAASSAARIRCAPLLSPSTTQAQPNPLTMLEREQRVVGHAPGQRGVDVGALGPGEREVLGLAAAAHTLRWRLGPRRRTRRRARQCAVVGQPGVGHRFERERADAVEQPVANLRRRIVVVDDHQRPAGEPTDDVDRRGGRHVERVEDGLDRERGVRRRRRWRAPTGRAGRRGTAGRSSTGSST